MAMNPSIQTTGKDRRLYIWAAALIPVIVLAGFARSYYLKVSSVLLLYPACWFNCTD